MSAPNSSQSEACFGRASYSSKSEACLLRAQIPAKRVLVRTPATSMKTLTMIQGVIHCKCVSCEWYSTVRLSHKINTNTVTLWHVATYDTIDFLPHWSRYLLYGWSGLGTGAGQSDSGDDSDLLVLRGNANQAFTTWRHGLQMFTALKQLRFSTYILSAIYFDYTLKPKSHIAINRSRQPIFLHGSILYCSLSLYFSSMSCV